MSGARIDRLDSQPVDDVLYFAVSNQAPAVDAVRSLELEAVDAVVFDANRIRLERNGTAG
ncbi:hypothetical protein [Antrihabitans cavernicola]|uniref:Uncharacterized protein n=1 Tax=Antrihabitans cavernicola TaxID=2495913 RepID=A0A5A7S7K0_9NOCA|nr:hypothetical protein [Spelaeibacter cavernicola]KAA0017668.1 hypothetical protein FOY51_24850 [Spelaeibacter cavernicola]